MAPSSWGKANDAFFTTSFKNESSSLDWSRPGSEEFAFAVGVVASLLGALVSAFRGPHRAHDEDAVAREPRVRIPKTDALETNSRLERRQDIKEAHGHSHGPGPIEPRK